jgi:hypothetical protein
MSIPVSGQFTSFYIERVFASETFVMIGMKLSNERKNSSHISALSAWLGVSLSNNKRAMVEKL